MSELPSEIVCILFVCVWLSNFPPSHFLVFPTFHISNPLLNTRSILSAPRSTFTQHFDFVCICVCVYRRLMFYEVASLLLSKWVKSVTKNNCKLLMCWLYKHSFYFYRLYFQCLLPWATSYDQSRGSDSSCRPHLFFKHRKWNHIGHL